MPKEILKEYPFSSIACALVAALFVQGLFVGDDSVITNAMLQAGWCGAGDYICVLRYYSCFSLITILVALVIDLSRKVWKKSKQLASPLIAKVTEEITKNQGVDIAKLRLADGMLDEKTWYEYEEHPLTIINDTGHNIKKCCVMLDEVAWKNPEDKWEVVAKDVFDRPFKWNRSNVLDGKIDIESGDRASFVFISHNERIIYNSTEKQDDITTDFDFVFLGDEHIRIGYGSNIRLRISIRGKYENDDIDPIIYLLFVHLKQHHGIPKVDVVKRERVKKRTAT
jgi:hypothetical protein